MRLFIAITLSQETREFLSKIRLPARMAREFHLTLRFLGEVPDEKVEKITAALDKINLRNFTFSLSGIGFFPNGKRPRVVWTGIVPPDDVIRLEKMIDDCLAVLGFPREKRYHPHITLARARRGNDPRALANSAMALKIPPLENSVMGFELIKSTLTPDGPIHETLKTFINKSGNPEG